MKKEIQKKHVSDFAGKKITRKTAIKKTGLLAASTATMMILLKSKDAQAGSPGCDRMQGRGHQTQTHTHNHHDNNNNNNGPWKTSGK